jgi:hypothetical protein
MDEATTMPRDKDKATTMICNERESTIMPAEERTHDKEAAWMKEQREAECVIAEQRVCAKEAIESVTCWVEDGFDWWFAQQTFCKPGQLFYSNRAYREHGDDRTLGGPIPDGTVAVLMREMPG